MSITTLSRAGSFWGIEIMRKLNQGGGKQKLDYLNIIQDSCHLTTSSSIILHTPILNSLGNMDKRYMFCPLQVGNGTGNFEDTAIGPGGKPEPIHGLIQQAGGILIKGTAVFYKPGAICALQ